MPGFRLAEAKEIPIGDFAPDVDPSTPGILLNTMGAQPTMKGYQALNLPTPLIAGGLPGTPLGSAVAFYTKSGNIQYWAGDVNHLYNVRGSSWAVADGNGPSFNATRWRFAQYGSDLIAVGGTGVAPQVANGPTGTFGALGGSPPTGATCVTSVNSQVMMAKGQSWFVSAIGSDSSWAASTQTQAGNAPLTDYPGDIVALTPLFRGVIAAKQNAMWLLTYVGGTAIWSSQVISDQTGTWGQECMIPGPDFVAFLGIDDFYMTTGYTPQRIPNQLKEWFFHRSADPAKLQFTVGRFDPHTPALYWYYCSRVAPDNVPDRYVAYNYRVQRWARGNLSVSSVPYPNTQPGITNGLYFDSSNVLQTDSGIPGSMTLRSGYVGEAGRLTQLFRIMPKYSIYPANQTLLTWHTHAIGTNITAGPNAVLNEDGWFYLRQYDRYHQIEIQAEGSLLGPAQMQGWNGAEISAVAYATRQGGWQ